MATPTGAGRYEGNVCSCAEVCCGVQVLKDAKLRAAYDMQLLEAGHEKGLFISAEVSPSPISCPVSASSL